MRTLSNHAALQQVSQPAADGERLAAILSIPAAADDKAGWAYRIPHELAEYDCFVESDPEDEQLVSRLGEASVLDKPLALFLSASQAGAAQRLADADFHWFVLLGVVFPGLPVDPKPWSTWSAVSNLTSRAGELRSAPSEPDDRYRATG